MATASMVRVNSEIFGARSGEDAMPTVSVDLSGLEAALDERVTVHELIGRVVEQQIRELKAKRHSEAAAAPDGRPEEVREVLRRQYLTADEVEHGASAGGAVKMPLREASGEEIDVEAEVRRARRAFERGAFYVIVDGHQAESLHEPVDHKPGTRITFVRVMPLAGG